MRVRAVHLEALALSALLACVGEVEKGNQGDGATAMEPGPSTDPDGGVTPTPGKPDASVQDARGPAAEADAQGAVPTPPDAAARDAATTPQDANVATPEKDAGMVGGGKKPVFVAVGYSGIRMVSWDLGKTWSHSATLMGKDDDNNLLRSVTYANGTFVAVGWKIWTSTDAKSWTERTNAAQQWLGGVDFGNGVFAAAGGVGTSAFSSDGVTWTKGKDRNGEHTRTLAFGGGKFMCATDPGNWWSSTDGNNWTKDSGGHSNQVMWCKDKFSAPSACSDPLAHGNGRTAFGEGVYVSANDGKLERSENGTTWTQVRDRNEAAFEDVAFGYAP